jgi:TRAP-type C4-dicarboxylate transport system permease small subunit
VIIDCLDRWSASASRGLYRIGVYGALPALLVLVTADVVLRYAFNTPLQWGRDANGLLLLIVIFSALPQAWDQGYHIRMEIFYTRMSPRWRSVADIFSAMSGFVFFGMLCIQAAMFTGYMYRTGETGEDLNARLWPFMFFVAVSGFIFAVRLLMNPSVTTERSQGVTDEWS